MNEPIEEQLSAFMDGELGRDETRFVLRRAETDAVLARRWSRYHVARQALRRQEIVVLRPDFSAALMARLEIEDVPQTQRTVWLRWGSGGAIAAAVAVAALMVTKPSTGPEITPIAASSPATTPRVGTLAPAATTQVATAANVSVFPSALVPNSPIQTTAASFGSDVTEPSTFDPRLQPYVIRHFQPAGQSDVAPYVLLKAPTQTPEPRQAENR